MRVFSRTEHVGLRLRSAVAVLAVSVLVFLCTLVPAALAGSSLHGFKMVDQGNVMLHIDLDSSDASVNMFTLTDPHRLVIDIPQATLATDIPTENFNAGIVESIRYAQHGEDFLRVVLDLRGAVSPSSQMVPRQGGQRLVVDLGVPADARLPSPAEAPVYDQPRDVVIAIDAGHGGRDPGAIGRRQTYEKDVVLAIAIRLHNQLFVVPGIKPVLIRETDEYIALRDRMEIARQAEADIFVSIHADAINRETARGSSVYALSLDGASSEAAAWLAKSENEAAALYGDVSLEGLEDGLAKTLINLTQGNTMERSIELGTDVLNELASVTTVHKSSVEQAAFAVLKSPDIPSILVETAFISNLEEEQKLNDPEHQQTLAFAIAQGLYNYLVRRAPEGTYLAEQRQGRAVNTGQ